MGLRDLRVFSTDLGIGGSEEDFYDDCSDSFFLEYKNFVFI